MKKVKSYFLCEPILNAKLHLPVLISLAFMVIVHQAATNETCLTYISTVCLATPLSLQKLTTKNSISDNIIPSKSLSWLKIENGTVMLLHGDIS